MSRAGRLVEPSLCVRSLPSAPAAEADRVVARTGPLASDAELVIRALEGNAFAEAALCRAYAKPLVSMLTRLLGNHADADEVAQDAFVVALESLAKLRSPDAFRGWLFGIATNLGRRRMRRRRLESILGLAPAKEEANLDIFGSHTISPDTRAELSLLAARVEKLSVDLKIAWMLRYVEGYELTEVAAMCDCSLATIKRRLERASQRLDVYVGLERNT